MSDVFKMSKETVERLKVIAGITDGAVISRDMFIKNGEESSITYKKSLKDIPDDFDFNVLNIISFLNICGSFEETEIDYSKYSEKYRAIEIRNARNHKEYYVFIETEDSTIEKLECMLPFEKNIVLPGDCFNEYELSPEDIKTLIKGGNLVGADVILFKVINDVLTIEVCDSEASNSNKFKIEKADADIAHTETMSMTFSHFTKLDKEFTYKVKYNDGDTPYMEFLNDTEGLQMTLGCKNIR